MSLDVWLNERGEMPYIEIAHHMELVVSLDWDGYFVFLSRYWSEIEEECGPIDLYDTNTFYGDELTKLENCLLVARAEALLRQDVWTEHTGTKLTEPPEEIHQEVERSKLVALVDKLVDATRRARIQNKQLLFFGD